MSFCREERPIINVNRDFGLTNIALTRTTLRQGAGAKPPMVQCTDFFLIFFVDILLRKSVRILMKPGCLPAHHQEFLASDKAQGHSRFLFTKLLMISWDSTFKYFRCSSSTVCLHNPNSMKKYLTKLMVLPRLQSSTKTTWNSSHPDKLCCKMLQVWPGQFDVPSSLFGLLPHPTDLGWTHIPSSSLVH